MSATDDKAIEAAASVFVLAWPVDAGLPPWPLDYRDAGLQRFVRSVIAAYEAALWQPIESAPRDGATLIGWFDEFDEQLTIIWSDTRGGSWRLAGMGSVELGDWGQPMRWRHLPAPPAPAPDAPESRSFDGAKHGTSKE